MSDLARILSEMNRRLGVLEAREERARSPFGLPGFKHPYIGVAPIFIDSADTRLRQAVFNISPSGPFVWTGMAAFWYQNGGVGTAIGEFRPISSLTDTGAPPTVNAIDFHYTLSAGGSGWKFQNLPLGSPTLYSNFDRPSYQQTEFLLKGNESLVITAQPTIAPVATGFLVFCFNGYKILSSNALGDIGRGPSVDELPGLRIPYKAKIPITFDSSSAGPFRGSYTHSATGLFVVTAIHGTWLPTTSSSANKFRHISALQDGVSADPQEITPDFHFRITTNGNDLQWQTIPTTIGLAAPTGVPSPLLFTNRERPLYLAAPAQITPNSTVTVECFPILNPKANGTVDVILDGYIIAQGDTWKGE